MEPSAKRQKLEVTVKQGLSKPLFALFPSTQPRQGTDFDLYSNTSSSSLVAAHTHDIDYASLPLDHNGEDDDEVESQYMLAVFDKRKRTLTMHPAPVHVLKPSVRALDAIDEAASNQATAAQRRAALGTAFGTKKAQRALNAQERNKMTATSYGTDANVQNILQAAIATSSASLPSMQDVQAQANLARQIPPPNMSATSPDDAYDLADVVSDAELAVFALQDLINMKSQKERNEILPHKRSSFVATRMSRILRRNPDDVDSIPEQDQLRLKLLCHLAFLFAFRRAAGQKEVVVPVLSEKLGNPPPIVTESLLARYAEPVAHSSSSSKGGNDQQQGGRRKVTSTTDVKLLTYMAYIVLYVDKFSTDATLFANDLGLSPTKIKEVFRSLGCQVVAPTTAEAEKAVGAKQYATVAEAKKSRKAVLKVPLEFPKERRGAPKR